MIENHLRQEKVRMSRKRAERASSSLIGDQNFNDLWSNVEGCHCNEPHLRVYLSVRIRKNLGAIVDSGRNNDLPNDPGSNESRQVTRQTMCSGRRKIIRGIWKESRKATW